MQRIIKRCFIYLFTIVVTFLLGVVVIDTVNFYNSNYEIVFTINEEFDYTKLEDKDYLISIKNTHEKYDGIDIDEMIKNDDVNITYENNTNEFSFKVDKKVTTEVKDKLIETNHITIYNCDITKINESV